MSSSLLALSNEMNTRGNGMRGRGGFRGRGFGNAIRGRGSGNLGSLRSGWGVCFNCGQGGHPAAICPNWGVGQMVNPAPAGNPADVCGCCGQQGHGRAHCPYHQGGPKTRGPCCRGSAGGQPRQNMAGVGAGPRGAGRVGLPTPTIAGLTATPATLGSNVQETSTAVNVIRDLATNAPAEVEVREVMFTISTGWALVPAGSAGNARLGTHLSLDITPANIAPLSALVAQYDSVTFDSLWLEIIPPGVSSNVLTLWTAWVSDASASTDRVQSLPRRVVVRGGATATTLVEASFERFSRYAVTTRRTRSGARLRMFMVGGFDEAARGAFELTLMARCWCHGRVGA